MKIKVVLTVMLFLFMVATAWAISLKISDRPVAGTLDGSEIVGIIQGGEDVQTTVSSILGGAVAGWPTVSSSKEANWMNSFANAMLLGDGTRKRAIYSDATNGNQDNCVVSGVENDCNYTRWLLTGKTFSFLANDRTTPIGTLTSAASSGSWTNMTLNVESTGNVITTVSKVNFQAVGCSGTSGTLLLDTNATLAPTPTCLAGSTNTTLMQGYADFPDSDGEYQFQTNFRLPSDWTGAIDLNFRWKSAATTGNVVWQVASLCRTDGEIEDAAWNTADAVTADAAKGTTLQLNDASITGITTTGCAAGEQMYLKFFRQRTHASDTITGVVSLKGVELTLRRAQ